MIGLLSGNEETVEAYKGGVGKVIKSILLDAARGDSGALIIRFTDDTGIIVWDDGQSCCESRYMTTDDDLSAFVGATLNDMDIRDGGTVGGGYEEHEVQFLVVNTSLGSFTCETHNEHNGYYGGFLIRIRQL